MNDRPIVIDAIEISYVATESGETECDGVPIGRHSIECKYLPMDLQRKIVKYIASIEQLHAAYDLLTKTEHRVAGSEYDELIKESE